MKLILTSKIFSFFLLLCCLSINNIVNAGKGGGAGRSERVNFDEPLTYRMKQWYELIITLEQRLGLHYNGIQPLPPAGFESVNTQIGTLRAVYTGAQMQLDEYYAAVAAAQGRRFMR